MDVFNEAECRFYEGKLTCTLQRQIKMTNLAILGRLIVEIHDHRRSKNPQNAPEIVKRVVMQPTAESLWTDVKLLNEKWGHPWTEDIALEVESRLLVATEEPLCLDPTVQVTRLSNALENSIGQKRVKKKQKWNSLEREQKQAKKAENDKLMTLMDRRSKRSFPFEPRQVNFHDSQSI